MNKLYSVLSSTQNGQILPIHKSQKRTSKKGTKLSKAGGMITAISALLATTLKANAKEDALENSASKLALTHDGHSNDICYPIDGQLDNASLLKAIANFQNAASKTSTTSNIKFEKLDRVKTSSLQNESADATPSNNAVEKSNASGSVQQLVGAEGAANIDTPHITILDRATSAIEMSFDIGRAQSVQNNNEITQIANDPVQTNTDAAYQEAIEQLQIELEANSSLLKSHEAQIDALFSAMQEAESNYHISINVIKEAHNSNTSALKAQIEMLELENDAQDTTLNNAIAKLNDQLTKAAQDYAQNIAELTATMNANDQAQDAEIEALKAQEAALTVAHDNAVKALQNQIDALILKNEEQEAASNAALDALRTELSDAQNQNALNIAELANSMENLRAELEAEIAALTEQNAALIEENSQAIDALLASNLVKDAEFDLALSELNDALALSDEKLNGALAELETLKTQLSQLEDQLNDTSNDVVEIVQSNVLFGTSSEDDFLATDADEIIYGMSGDDKIAGGGGADTIYGGEGIDLADYTNSNEAVEIDLAAATGKYGDAEGDSYFEIEGAIGSDFDDLLMGSGDQDHLFGGDGVDTIFGAGGDDLISGGKGADILNGQEGIDTAVYTNSGEAIDVSLFSGEGYEGDAEGDMLSSIENVNGSQFNDFIEGDDLANQLFGDKGDDEIYALNGNDTVMGGEGDDMLFGEQGDDVLVGGLGADLLIGGEGMDTADYTNAAEGVFLYKDFGGLGGEAEGDFYDSIEIIQGSQFEDYIVGNADDETFFGNDGNDSLFGAGGDDIFIGGAGNDTLRGGEGNDLFIFEGNFDTNFIADFEAGTGPGDQIQIQDEYVQSWDDVQYALTTNGFDVVLTLEGGSITIENTTLDQLAEDDFIIG